LSPPPARATRTDAARNREALVDAAREAFTRSGEQTSLEAIARAAGVGIGTLYRHFPRRSDLVAEVYAAELDAVLADAERLRTRHETDVAFRAWLGRYAKFMAAKRGMAETLRAGVLAGAAEAARTRERVNETVESFLRDGADSGVFRPGISADDVTTMIVGIGLATGDNSTEGQFSRLCDLLVHGLRA